MFRKIPKLFKTPLGDFAFGLRNCQTDPLKYLKIFL